MANCKHGLDSRFCAACADPALSQESKRRLLMARAVAEKPATVAEREAYEAVFAYEEAKSKINDKTTRANRTWPLIREKGVIAPPPHGNAVMRLRTAASRSGLFAFVRGTPAGIRCCPHRGCQ